MSDELERIVHEKWITEPCGITVPSMFEINQQDEIIKKLKAEGKASKSKDKQEEE